MQAFMQPRLVKFESTGVKANALQVRCEPTATDAKTVGKRFMATLLSCLSAWGT